jgi:hypothetical protein
MSLAPALQEEDGKHEKQQAYRRRKSDLQSS